MTLVIFEDDGLAGFGPLVLTRHAGTMRRGTKGLADAIRDSVAPGAEFSLWGRGDVDGGDGRGGSRYNAPAEENVTLVNARARPGRRLADLVSREGTFVALEGPDLVAAKVGGRALTPGPLRTRDAARLAKSHERIDAPGGSLFRGYWELVESNGLAVAEQARPGGDRRPVPDGVEVRGSRSNLMMSASAEVEAHTAFDTRLGPIVVSDGASVESFSRVAGPCFVGPKARVLSALVGGGTSIFESCKVGGQVENSIVSAFTNKAHHGYLGDSYVGEWVNLGAGSTFGNLKNTYGDVRVDVAGERRDTGLLKLGAAVGDMCKVSIGALVYAGKMLGTGCQASGLVDRNVPSFTFYSGKAEMVELRVDSVVETQRRMMERRGLALTKAGEATIRSAFEATAHERRQARVRKGKLP